MKSLFTVIAFTGLSFSAFANHNEKHTGGPSAEEIQKMMQLTAPGEEHALLKDLVGNWKVTSKFWMDSESPAEESKGTQTNKLIMDGRFLQTDHKGKAMGKSFKGMGLLGFDKVRGEYQSMWIDSMNTSLMTSSGTYNAGTKTLKESGSASCPMTGETDRKFRAEWNFTDKNHYSYAMFTKDSKKKEFKALELNFTRN